ncbi:ABC transporter permease [Microvirga lotononidis]|uniref:ABC-type dipeptide/oligopeptide/nickel transport system, permease component n=1 Tax=Microvirga lotononidis TaxID=864069 RepID=I4Z161_9HYPH|nr:ABC transporter permease [Microvirga lotononidis]EIM29953.1 ABC-type dipeptide/oligopeptide/nickel transport system, permease component [Microvirga lotononidis]WQO31986.1 ABC transporter permease [Microvirga lotononidis]
MSEAATTNEPAIAGTRSAVARRVRPSGGRLLLGFGLAMLAILVLVTLLAPLISPYDPSATSPNSLEGSSPQHLLGTDAIGRDVLSRILVGGRTTLFVTFTSVAFALVAGLVLGLVSGYVGGWVDEAIMRVLDVVFAFPVFLLAIAVVAALGPTVPNLILTIAIVYTPAMSRVVRAPVLSVKKWDHVEAARSVGMSEFRIVIRHVLPMVVSPIVVATSLTLAQTIFTVTALSFLGLGPPPPDPNWGGMLADARQFMELAPLTVVGPAVAIVFATLTFIVLANGLREVLDVGSDR